MNVSDYVIQVHDSPLEIPGEAWNALLEQQPCASPFLRHEYLCALHKSGCAVAQTGWAPRFFTVWDRTALDPREIGQLRAACALYLKFHSYGEYVFDWAWANAYSRAGLAYYPKAVIASPFTPVPGTKLLARNAVARAELIRSVLRWTQEQKLSSLHLLFASEADTAACDEAGMMLRHGVQFHWTNEIPKTVEQPTPNSSIFESFLQSLTHEKRKKIRQERRKVREAGVTVRCLQGTAIETEHWDFFYRCYEQTYREHGNPPYLNRAFFQNIADTLPQHWLMFVADQCGKPVASSLIGLARPLALVGSGGGAAPNPDQIAYGRYWGALQSIDCLHFELCYYQPLQWCLDNGVARFEGGAQGEHKMARALLPVQTTSAHWLAHPTFADAVRDFLAREEQSVDLYMQELNLRSPFKQQK